ncbi:isoaspartyl peptidase/L-asparaginase family protein [Thermoproteus tenax]|uniref:Plant-type L-asparaginase n=1 Tax=Thermoproteus tenax (strain ATCC 35583 / DSM 2078 / JCM 9277 / NBRC 100435 / Kra 1) TaxID=768679 RepID=G4RKU6_THETK|nr:L-asparaginase [Thermoproteus tenax Kra 1]
MDAVLAVHGGAGKWAIDKQEARSVLDALRGAVDAGLLALARGNALDGVTEAVAYMEESGLFNAGIGAVYTIDGSVLLDAGVMDGKTGRAGAVAAVEGVKSAVKLARFVLENTDHVLIVGEGAEELARAAGLAIAKNIFYNDVKNRRYVEAKREAVSGRWHYKKVVEIARELGIGDTVGAVARDREGNMAAATSTGGVWLKLKGRVGDSPIVGAGFWAENGVGAFSATGIGEVIMLSLLSFKAAERLKSGVDIDTALQDVLGRGHAEVRR